MARVSERMARKLFRDELLDKGLDYAQVAAELAARYELRPRAAWREARGWSLTETAARINAFRAGTGIDPDGSAGMSGPHLSEHEHWPGTGPRPRGRRPTPRILAELAAVYGCDMADLTDKTDRARMPPADLLVIDAHRAPAQPRRVALIVGGLRIQITVDQAPPAHDTDREPPPPPRRPRGLTPGPAPGSQAGRRPAGPGPVTTVTPEGRLDAAERARTLTSREAARPRRWFFLGYANIRGRMKP